MSNFHFEPVAKFNLISGKILLALPQMYSMFNIRIRCERAFFFFLDRVCDVKEFCFVLGFFFFCSLFFSLDEDIDGQTWIYLHHKGGELPFG